MSSIRFFYIKINPTGMSKIMPDHGIEEAHMMIAGRIYDDCHLGSASFYGPALTV